MSPVQNKRKSSLAPNNSYFISCKQAMKRRAVGFYCSLLCYPCESNHRFQGEQGNKWQCCVKDADTTMLTTLGAALLMMDVLFLTRDEHRL